MDEVKDQIELISGNKPIEYKKDFMNIKFKSDDNLPLGKIHKFFYMNVLISMNTNLNIDPMFFYKN